MLNRPICIKTFNGHILLNQGIFSKKRIQNSRKNLCKKSKGGVQNMLYRKLSSWNFTDLAYIFSQLSPVENTRIVEFFVKLGQIGAKVQCRVLLILFGSLSKFLLNGHIMFVERMFVKHMSVKQYVRWAICPLSRHRQISILL